VEDKLQFSDTVPVNETEAIRHFKQAIASGEHWYIALLQAIGLWTADEEIHDGRHLRYLIDGEAFDWLLLAERLCQTAAGLMPENEMTALLFHSIPPLKLTSEEFKRLIGSKKYHQYLNYFYGITVEEALIHTVQEEIRKEKRSVGLNKEVKLADEAYQRIYGASQITLLKQFRREKGYPQTRSTSLSELKEFAYWLFKYRLKHCEKVKVASDTNKALEQIRQNWSNNGFSGGPEADSPQESGAYLEVNPSI